MVRRLRWIVLAALAVYLGALGFLYVNQQAMLYPAGGSVVEPTEVGLADMDVVSIETADGERLRAWYHAPEPGEPAVVFFHGNGGSLEDRRLAFRTLIDMGVGLLAPTYRGYAGSTGSPSEAGLIEDGLAAYDRLAATGAPVVIHGQSLGSGVAVQVAARREPAGVVLEVPFSAAVDVAAERYPVFPVGLLMKDQWLSRDLIAGIAAPLLIVEAENDAVIPAGHAARLFRLAGEPKRHITLSGVDHNGAWRGGLDSHVSAFLADLGF